MQLLNGRMITRNRGTKMFVHQHPNIKSLQILNLFTYSNNVYNHILLQGQMWV